jgi:hypothetical protein
LSINNESIRSKVFNILNTIEKNIDGEEQNILSECELFKYNEIALMLIES